MAFQLLEYQMVWWVCRFDINLGWWPSPHSHQCTPVAEALVIIPVVTAMPCGANDISYSTVFRSTMISWNPLTGALYVISSSQATQYKSQNLRNTLVSTTLRNLIECNLFQSLVLQFSCVGANPPPSRPC